MFQNNDATVKTNLPFFADGYPGLMFQQTQNGLTVNPHKKLMPVLFLYGQTIHPIELEIQGGYRLIIFQLYPFVLKSFFNLSPQSLNDNCYDLQQLEGIDMYTICEQLQPDKSVTQKIEVITALLLQLLQTKKQSLDFKIKQVIERIIVAKGQEDITSMAASLHLNSRTLERRFRSQTGLSPKQFAKIIQFQSSLEQLTVSDFTKLSDIVYENGYADQSHFIKVFRAYTGKTPKAFLKK